MSFEQTILAPVTRRTFMKGVGAVAATMALPSLFTGAKAEAAVATGGGLRMMRFAHLTDLHFTTRKQNRYPTSYVHIKRAVADLNAQDLDFVLFTGDMFHFPEDIEADMPALQEALKGLRHPFYVALGNHDTEGDRVARRKKFVSNNLGDAGLAGGDPFYTFSPAPGIRFIVLDSTDVDGDSYHVWTGHLSERQFKWLNEQLVKFRDEMVFVAMHHPPITPYPFMDKLRFDNTDSYRLEALLKQFPNVQTMFAGHYHFGGRNTFANAELILGPSLVEHPHPYRIVEVQQQEKGKGAVHYQWQSLNLHGDEDQACAHGTPALRSLALLNLSYMRNGSFNVALAN
ncbi:3',5'-cyclic adenosine monophosphate phosphodiesterase CpdA [compost metagenome]